MRPLGVILARWVEMISASEPRLQAEDAVEVALEISWITAEIAVDVFGMFFWGAPALLFLRAIG